MGMDAPAPDASPVLQLVLVTCLHLHASLPTYACEMHLPSAALAWLRFLCTDPPLPANRVALQRCVPCEYPLTCISSLESPTP